MEWPYGSYKVNQRNFLECGAWKQIMKKVQGCREILKNCQTLTFWPYWVILDMISLIPGPHCTFFNFFFCWLILFDPYGHFEYIKYMFYFGPLLGSANFQPPARTWFCYVEHFSGGECKTSYWYPPSPTYMLGGNIFNGCTNDGFQSSLESGRRELGIRMAQ